MPLLRSQHMNATNPQQAFIPHGCSIDTMGFKRIVGWTISKRKETGRISEDSSERWQATDQHGPKAGSQKKCGMTQANKSFSCGGIREEDMIDSQTKSNLRSR